MKKPEKRDTFLKVKDNQVLWFNGVKWLVKETLKTKEKALSKLKELHGRKK